MMYFTIGLNYPVLELCQVGFQRLVADDVSTIAISSCTVVLYALYYLFFQICYLQCQYFLEFCV